MNKTQETQSTQQTQMTPDSEPGTLNSELGTVLVTGGAGFIGTNLVKYLSERGYKVKILDNLTTASREFVSQESRVTSPPPQPSTRN